MWGGRCSIAEATLPGTLEIQLSITIEIAGYEAVAIRADGYGFRERKRYRRHCRKRLRYGNSDEHCSKSCSHSSIVGRKRFGATVPLCSPGIALFSMQVEPPLRLRPGQYPTDVALRTVSEALANAGSEILEIEPGELMAEYRPSLTPEGREVALSNNFRTLDHFSLGIFGSGPHSSFA